MAREGRAYRTSTVHGIRVGMVAAGVDTEAAREPRCRWPLSARRHAAANAALAEARAPEEVEGVTVVEAQAPGSYASHSQANNNKEIEENTNDEEYAECS